MIYAELEIWLENRMKEPDFPTDKHWEEIDEIKQTVFDFNQDNKCQFYETIYHHILNKENK